MLSAPFEGLGAFPQRLLFAIMVNITLSVKYFAAARDPKEELCQCNSYLFG